MTPELGEAERLAVAGAPAGLRPCYAAILGLDRVLSRIAVAASEPMLAQLRLAWWRDRCAALDRTGHPLLEALGGCWHAGSEPLVALVDAWEAAALADIGLAASAEPLAAARCAAMAACAEADRRAGMAAARCWTLVTLADHAGGAAERAAMLAQAGAATLPRLPRSLRPLAILGGLARRAARRGGGRLIGDRLSPFAAMRLGIFGR